MLWDYIQFFVVFFVFLAFDFCPFCVVIRFFHPLLLVVIFVHSFNCFYTTAKSTSFWDTPHSCTSNYLVHIFPAFANTTLLTGSSSSRNSMMNVASVDTVPRNMLIDLSTTSEVLGTLNRREKGYIRGIMAQLKCSRL